ncbi:MAG: serine/threonine protein kinase, partial [Xanthomonadales bacterium]|nr:serine/threonine protein kinase [Xanthomonadales bacterium]
MVYRAERRLGDATQTAALKLLTVSALAADGRQLQREHQALARLQHPGIVPLLDAGVLEDGTPYLAMPLVEGERIDRWCAQQALSVNGIVTLFRQVCDAVAYAHRRRIIHRDLKPGNILVNQDGKPKVIDFGVARAVEEDGPTRTRMTCAGELVGTLQYMSPEQCTENADAIDIRSDVYSLGLVLFELLTGERPYELSQTPLVEAARIIREGRVPRPSTHDRALRGDLDNIVLKALRK